MSPYLVLGRCNNLFCTSYYDIEDCPAKHFNPSPTHNDFSEIHMDVNIAGIKCSVEYILTCSHKNVSGHPVHVCTLMMKSHKKPTVSPVEEGLINKEIVQAAQEYFSFHDENKAHSCMEISNYTGLSYNTVKNHLASFHRNFRCNNLSALSSDISMLF